MVIKLFSFIRVQPPSVRLFAFLILVVFAVTSLVLFNSSFTDQKPSWLPKSDSHVIKIEKIDDYDAACSGYSIGRILREQKRILASVHAELTESQIKIEEIRAVQEELQRLIPQKQLELSALEGEIEAAQRQLEELRETQNVRVFLPYSPLQMPSQKIPTSSGNVLSFDDIIDYSRCSISSFMPIFIHTTSSSEVANDWMETFRGVSPNLVEQSKDACLTIQITDGDPGPINRSNLVLLNIGKPVKNPNAIMVQSSELRKFDYAIDARSVPVSRNTLPPLLPLLRDKLMLLILQENHKFNLTSLEQSAGESLIIKTCSTKECDLQESETIFKSFTFCLLPQSPQILKFFSMSLRSGCIPIVLSDGQMLPFEDLIDWRRASFRMSPARLPEAHFILRSFEMADVLEMRRMGNTFYETYLADRTAVAKSLIAAIRFRLQIPTRETSLKNRAVALFNTSFTAPKGSVVSVQTNFDDEYLLGPLESRVPSPTFSFNFTEFQMYSYNIWNSFMSPFRSKEFLIGASEPPADAEFYEDTKTGFRPIEPGSGVEFSKNLGGNRQREQFTVIILTYERDTVLVGALERLHQIPYLNKVIVVWNNVHREPPDTWPSLHVPVEFIRVSQNSLNNRFVPWDRIETEAVLSLDDDIDLMQQEIVLAFRVWRENRDRIVGFPARYHARYGDSMFYNSNHTCQMSMILTGAAFLHKNYLHAYTYEMNPAIREHVDTIRNCEDIAMNYLVAHLTRRPPIKTTSRWTLKCPTCTESLFKEDSHFEKRHECMRLFTEIYGYNPLRFSQFRVDSILFKTRLPQNHQKCFKYV